MSKINKTQIRLGTQAAYMNGGVSRVWEWIRKNAKGTTDTAHCPACDAEVPIIKGEHDCLVCGQPTTPIQG